ncbi:MAG TPA: M28 family peptidase, partial [Solirubrobacterales bacterium]|nr:M28 family peptidase [Solirubrobacterales bacterium]
GGSARGSGERGCGRGARGCGGFARGRGRGGVLRRVAAAALGAFGAAGIASDFPPNRRHLRRLLPSRQTTNVVCEVGPADAERTVVLISHHDAAHGGLVFHPALPQLADRLGLIDRSDTSPMMMAPVVGGPALAALGALIGSRRLSRLGLALSLGSTAAMADIGSRRSVPGANDNGTAVVTLLAIAARLRERAPRQTRVILLSAGAEESFSEGIKAFGERHFAQLPRESTFFLCLDTIGSPHLCVLRGEGFLRMHEYPEPALAVVDGVADELGIEMMPNLRLHNGTDGLEPLAAGYPAAALCSCTELKQPANYHTFRDTAANINYETLANAIRLTEAVIHRLDRHWLTPPRD